MRWVVLPIIILILSYRAPITQNHPARQTIHLNYLKSNKTKGS